MFQLPEDVRLLRSAQLEDGQDLGRIKPVIIFICTKMGENPDRNLCVSIFCQPVSFVSQLSWLETRRHIQNHKKTRVSIPHWRRFRDEPTRGSLGDLVGSSWSRITIGRSPDPSSSLIGYWLGYWWEYLRSPRRRSSWRCLRPRSWCNSFHEPGCSVGKRAFPAGDAVRRRLLKGRIRFARETLPTSVV